MGCLYFTIYYILYILKALFYFLVQILYNEIMSKLQTWEHSLRMIFNVDIWTKMFMQTNKSTKYPKYKDIKKKQTQEEKICQQSPNIYHRNQLLLFMV